MAEAATEKNRFSATGKRKTSVARVLLTSGTGTFTVNGRSLDDYFPRQTLRMHLMEPFEVVDMVGDFDGEFHVSGGGIAGQASAIRHGISRALLRMDETLRSALKKAGLLTRDPRMKERKKYGQRGARARFQFSKR